MSRMYSSPRVLVIQDQPGEASELLESLQQAGYETLTASTNSDILGRVHMQRPDVAILDLTHPQSTGIPEARTLRRFESDLPVIIMTASGNPERASTAMRTGVFEYLTKPFELTELLQSVADAMISHRAVAAGREVSRA